MPNKVARTISILVATPSVGALAITACHDPFYTCYERQNCPPMSDAVSGSAGTAGGHPTGGTSNENIGGSSSGGQPLTPACTAECSGEKPNCCGAECVDLQRDMNNCGECGTSCFAANTQAVCEKGQCIIRACPADSLDCNRKASDGCETPDVGKPSAPKLLSPPLGSFTGTAHASSNLQPTLRWNAPTDGTCPNLTYEVQLEDSCSVETYRNCLFASPEVHATGISATQWAPTQPLKVRKEAPLGTRYYWRVRACDAPDHCSDWSQVRYLNVGRSRDDLNGDGYSDLAYLSAGSTVYLTIAPGANAPFKGENASRVVHIPTLDAPGRYARLEARFLGDINADGFADLAVSWGASAAKVLLGGTDLKALKQVPITVSSGTTWLRIGRIGDWNGDGYDDLIIGEPENARSSIHFGHADSGVLTTAAFTTFPSVQVSGSYFGASVGGVGDMDGNGHPEIATLSPSENALYVYTGGSTKDTVKTHKVSVGSECVDGGSPDTIRAIEGGVDVNGDGYQDALVCCKSALWMISGAPQLPLQATHTLTSSEIKSLAVGDAGSDSLGDLLLIAKVDTENPIPYSVTFTSATPAMKLLHLDIGDSYYLRLATFGDHNGDGAQDIVLATLGTSPAYESRWFAAPPHAQSVPLRDWSKPPPVITFHGKSPLLQLAQ